MKILLGTHYLAKTGGTESYTYALAMELKRLGHEVEYFAIVRGRTSSLLEEKGVPFMSADHYDLILANHNTVVEKLWSYGYIVQTCHGNIAQLEQPSPYADAYVSVSEEVRNYLLKKGFCSKVVISNGIDCNRFYPKTPVSQTLKTVLSLCQSDIANDFIRRCCEQVGIKFLQSNKFIDNVWSIEELINQSDLVIGLGRSAYDAMACGRCVLVYDYREYMGEFLGDGMLTPESIGKSMTCNCSGRANRIKYDEQAFITEIRKYSPELGVWGREYALEHLNIEVSARKYLDIYKGKVNNQEYSAYKARMKKLLEDNYKKAETAIGDKEKLREQLFSIQHQMNTMLEFFSAKSQKHLRAIRILVWFCAVLILLLIALVFYMFL
ncbi:MAG: glycosyltransferase family 4 protein [Bacteroidaceae bacterium]|nr:glycosyltransferase family 4 protein [Bacteroidaceae bacterium]